MPELFNVLVKEVRGLGLNMELLDAEEGATREVRPKGTPYEGGAVIAHLHRQTVPRRPHSRMRRTRQLSTNPFNPVAPVKTFDEIKISPGLARADPVVVLGAIKKPETINYRTFKPERDGSSAPVSWPDQGLRMPLRQIQATKYRGVVCAKMRR